jgi:thiamine pyrophosphokinase
MTHTLIFANGKPKDGAMVQQALHDAGADALVIAADGGARVAWHYERTPQVVIGDMDSLSEAELQQLAQTGATIQRYPAEKNETDLELALLYAARQSSHWIRIIGGIGGRFDQMLANVYLLALPQIAACDIAIVARNQSLCLLRAGDHLLQGQAGDTISLIPMSGDVHGITTHDLKYALDDDTLKFGPARGVSNIMMGHSAHVSVGSGMLLCVHTKGGTA